MNAPFRDRGSRTVDDLVADHLAREDRVRDGLRHGESRLTLFMRKLARARRRRQLRLIAAFLKRMSGIAGSRGQKARGSGARAWHGTAPIDDGFAIVGAWADVEVDEDVNDEGGRAHLDVRPALRLVALAAVLSVLIPASVFAINTAFPETMNAALSAMVTATGVRDAEVEALETRIACATHAEVHDAEGRFVRSRLVSPEACRDGRPFYITTPVSVAVAERMTAAISSIEGRSLIAERRSLLGVVDGAIFKRALEKLVRGGRLPGSPPLLTAIESARGRTGALGWPEKLESLALAASYSARNLRSDRERQRFIAMHMPCVRGNAGSRFGPARAGGQCAWALFGKPADKAMSLGEVCIMAGAAGYQLLVPGSGAHEDALAAADRRLERVKVRARNCARRMNADAGKVEEAIAFIDAYRPDAALAAFTARLRAGAGMIVLADSLAQHLPVDAEGIARLSVDIDVQAVAAAAVRSRLSDLDRHLSDGLCFRTSGACTPPDVAVVIAERPATSDTLEIRAAYTNRHGMLFGREGARHRLMGSAGKVPLALTMDANARLCDRSFAGRRNAGGTTGVASCADGHGLMPARVAFARSSNLPLIDHVRQHEPRIVRLYRELGYWVAGDDPDARALGIVLGHGLSVPLAHHLSVLGAIHRGSVGEEPRLRGIGVVAGDIRSPVDLGAALTAAGFSGNRFQNAARLLAAPAEAGGTAAALAPALAALGCTRIIAKTGTAETAAAETGVRTRALLAAFNCGPRSFAAAVVVGAPGDRDLAIGTVPSDTLASLIVAAFRPTLNYGG